MNSKIDTPFFAPLLSSTSSLRHIPRLCHALTQSRLVFVPLSLLRYRSGTTNRACGRDRPLPVGHARLVQRHEVDLARWATLGAWEEHLVVALAEEFESLRLLVHEHAVQVAWLDRADLDCFIAPAHYLSGADVRHWRWHLAPLKQFLHLLSKHLKYVYVVS